MIIYISILNIFSFILMGLDKFFAIKRLRRVSEKTLLFVALIGGAFGMWIAMMTFRHKTKYLKFKLLLPILSLLWIALFLFYLS